jgi:hypothetical protein
MQAWDYEKRRYSLVNYVPERYNRLIVDCYKMLFNTTMDIIC